MQSKPKYKHNHRLQKNPSPNLPHHCCGKEKLDSNVVLLSNFEESPPQMEQSMAPQKSDQFPGLK